jgi:hypothetical protein
MLLSIRGLLPSRGRECKNNENYPLNQPFTQSTNFTIMYQALQISPMIPSYNLKETAAFFTDVLSFTPYMLEDNYAILYKDNHTIHLLPAGDIGEMEFYLEVDDIDTLWDEIKEKLQGIKVREPFDREYGMRELHIIVPHTKTLLFVGQAIKK